MVYCNRKLFGVISAGEPGTEKEQSMPRTKKLPSIVLDYGSLSEEVKKTYDHYSSKYARENIYKLREIALELKVESPTTLKKDELVKRVTDKKVGMYFSLADKDEPLPAWEATDVSGGERVKGYFERRGSGNLVGKAMVPAALCKENKLRIGDIVEGVAADIMGVKTLTVVNSVEGEMPKSDRRNFAEMQAVARRKFGSLIAGTAIETILPGLEMGERVILSNMTRKTAQEILKSVPHSVGLFVGVEPESEAELDGNFVINFDDTEAEALDKAQLALERAKRMCEWGKDVVFVVHGFNALGNRDAERALFGLGRCFEAGSITVIADVNKDKEYGIFGKIATTIIE